MSTIFNMLFKKKAPKIETVYPKLIKKKISLDINYLINGKLYRCYHAYNLESINAEQLEKDLKKSREFLELMAQNIYTQLNEKTSEYLYIEEMSFILKKTDFLNCNIITRTID